MKLPDFLTNFPKFKRQNLTRDQLIRYGSLALVVVVLGGTLWSISSAIRNRPWRASTPNSEDELTPAEADLLLSKMTLGNEAGNSINATPETEAPPTPESTPEPTSTATPVPLPTPKANSAPRNITSSRSTPPTDISGASHTPKSGNVSLTSSILYNGISHRVSVQARTRNGRDSGYISISTGNRDRSYYRGEVSQIEYLGKHQATIQGNILIDGESTPITIQVEFEDRAWQVGYSLAGSHPYNLPIQKISSGSCSISSYSKWS